MDLVEFLRARLDEDEQAARAASPGPWRAESGYEGDEWAIKSPVSTADSFPSGDVAGPGYEGGGVWSRGDAEHIARHDPARALREIKAKRRIVARHTGDHMCPKPPQDHSWTEAGQTVEGLWPCGDLLDLARSYADHPEYDVVWGQGL